MISEIFTIICFTIGMVFLGVTIKEKNAEIKELEKKCGIEKVEPKASEDERGG